MNEQQSSNISDGGTAGRMSTTPYSLSEASAFKTALPSITEKVNLKVKQFVNKNSAQITSYI